MGWEKSDDSAMKHVTTTENMLGEPGSLRVLPVELLEKIVGFMIVAVELKNTTALRLTSSMFIVPYPLSDSCLPWPQNLSIKK